MLAMAAVFQARAPYDAGSTAIVRKGDRLAVAAIEAVNPSRGPMTSGVVGMQLASVETGVEFGGTTEDVDIAVASPGISFDDRFYFDPRLASFEERYGVTGVRASQGDPNVREIEFSVPAPPTGAPARTAADSPIAPEPPRVSVRRPDRKLAMLTPARLELPARIGGRDGRATREPSVSDAADGRTAIYDITAGAVYLPNGKKLEAHSGLGSHMDDPRAINLKGRGPTPPNVYRLAMRERLFHGVRAIRLIPADEGKMYGRDGMLAHSYMLGANGQSNGCVSFSDYPAFLDAYLKGDVDRLVVVERLDGAPGRASRPGWLAEAIGNLFKPADRAATPAPTDDHGKALSYQ